MPLMIKLQICHPYLFLKRCKNTTFYEHTQIGDINTIGSSENPIVLFSVRSRWWRGQRDEVAGMFYEAEMSGLRGQYVRDA